MNWNRALTLAALCGLMQYSPAQAQPVDIFTPIIGIGDCEFTAISAATPARVTVTNMAQCGLVSDGLIWTWGAWNSEDGGTNVYYSRINGQMINSTDEIGLCRMAKNVVGNQFDVYACDGVTPVSNNGETYHHGGRVARGQWRTRKDLPVVDFDGSGGYLDTCVQSSAAGGCYESGRLERTALDNVYATFPSWAIVDHGDPTGSWIVAAALRWAALGKPGSGTELDRVRAGMINNKPVPTMANNGLPDNGQPNSHYGDFSVEIYLSQWVKIYNLALSKLSPSELQELSDYYLADLPANKGGHNYLGTTLTAPSFKTVSGTISWTAGSATVTGNGTAFLTQVSPGDYITLSLSSFGRIYKVASIESDTSLTLNRVTNNGGNGTNEAYRVGRPYQAGTDLGFLWWHMNNYYSTLCNPGYPDRYGCQWYGNFGGGGFEANHNHNMGRNTEWLKLAITFAHVDPRWRWLATTALFHWYHRFQPGPWRTIGGVGQAAAGYHHGRITPYLTSTVGALKNSFTDSPDFLSDNAAGTPTAASTTWWDEMAAMQLFDYKPGRTNEAIQTGGEPQFFLCCGSTFTTGFSVNLFKPDNTFAAALKQHAQVDSGLATAAILDDSGNGGMSAGDTVALAYLGNRPSITPARTTQTSYFTRAALATTCGAIWQFGNTGGTSQCLPDRSFFLGSRSGLTAAGAWNGSGVLMRYDFQSTAIWDHAGQQHLVGPHYSANGKILIGGDGLYGGYDELTGGSIFVLGSESNFKAGSASDINGANGFGISTPIWGKATPQVAAASVDITSHYKPAAGVTAASRSVVHAKAVGLGFYLHRDDFAGPSLTAEVRDLYWIADGCGTTTSSPCMAVNRAARTAALTQTATTYARIESYYTGNGVTLDTANASDTDGSYPSQTGRSFRVAAKRTGTSGSILTVRKVTLSAGDTMPEITEEAAGAVSIVRVKSTTAPVLFASAPNATTNGGSVSFSSDHTGNAQLIATGRAAGTWEVRVDGVVPSGCGAVVVNAGEHLFNCDAVPAGAIVIQQVGAPVDIATASPLPSGTQGSAYSQTLTATGGTSPYTWTVFSGSLAPGLSLSSGGALTGTPSAAGGYSFTIRATDSASGFDDQVYSLTINSPGGGPTPGGAAVSGAAIRTTVK